MVSLCVRARDAPTISPLTPCCSVVVGNGEKSVGTTSGVATRCVTLLTDKSKPDGRWPMAT